MIKKKAGRPPRSSSPSNKFFAFRSTNEEMERLRNLAAKSGMTIADFIRSRIFN